MPELVLWTCGHGFGTHFDVREIKLIVQLHSGQFGAKRRHSFDGMFVQSVYIGVREGI